MGKLHDRIQLIIDWMTAPAPGEKLLNIVSRCYFCNQVGKTYESGRCEFLQADEVVVHFVFAMIIASWTS